MWTIRIHKIGVLRNQNFRREFQGWLTPIGNGQWRWSTLLKVFSHEPIWYADFLKGRGFEINEEEKTNFSSFVCVIFPH